MVEGARLESVCTGNRTEGSNPTLSATKYFAAVAVFLYYFFVERQDLVLRNESL